jgi:hypothetical protein
LGCVVEDFDRQRRAIIYVKVYTWESDFVPVPEVNIYQTTAYSSSKIDLTGSGFDCGGIGYQVHSDEERFA